MRAPPQVLLDVDYSSAQEEVCATDEGWTNMDKDEVISKLADAGIRSGGKRNGNDNGWRVDCEGGAIINLFDTGKVLIQGKNQEHVKQVLGLDGAPSGGAASVLAKCLSSTATIRAQELNWKRCCVGGALNP